MVKKRIIEYVTANDKQTRHWRSTFAAARMAYEVGEFRQAESLLARAFEVARELPERAIAVSVTEVGIAGVILAAGRSREAVNRLKKAMHTLEGRSGREDKELLAVALRFYSQALADGGDERTAERELQRSAAIIEALGEDACVQLAYSLCDLGGLYAMQGRISEADTCILRALGILGSTMGPDSREYVWANMIYKTCLPMQDEQRLEAAEDGIQCMEYMYGTEHPNMARALDRYFKVLSERGDTVRLEHAKERFSDIRKLGKRTKV